MVCGLCALLNSPIILCIGLIGSLIYGIYQFMTWRYDFFEKKNVTYVKPTSIFGNFGDIVMKRSNVTDLVEKLYNSYDEDFFGIFEMRNPITLLKDPELIKKIGVKYFDHFLDHRIAIDENGDPLFGKNLFSLRGEKWKHMRSTLSPAFTGSKIRHMIQFVNECSDGIINYYLNEAKENKMIVVEMKDLYARCANDVIASCAFGIKVNSIVEKDNEFYRLGKLVTEFRGIQSIKFLLYGAFPKLMNYLKVPFFPNKIKKFFRTLVEDTMKYREANGIIRPDMIHLLMEAKRGNLIDHIKENENDQFSMNEENNNLLSSKKFKLEDDDLTAQCLLFFLAGFETSSTLLCFVTHELAVNPDIQQKLIDEIDGARKDLDGKSITYEKMQGMKYLDMVVSESLRKWPPGFAIDRICTKPYKIESKGKSIQLNRGDAVWIPIVGLHRDPKYFPNPEKFDPERFNDENKKNIVPCTYLPFGVGPRNCIGSRFALMEAKLIIINLLTHFKFEVSEKTQVPLKLSKAFFAIKAEKGFWIHLKPRKIQK